MALFIIGGAAILYLIAQKDEKKTENKPLHFYKVNFNNKTPMPKSKWVTTVRVNRGLKHDWMGDPIKALKHEYPDDVVF